MLTKPGEIPSLLQCLCNAFAKLAVSKKNNHILSLTEELLGKILGIKILCQPFLALVSCFFVSCEFLFAFLGNTASLSQKLTKWKMQEKESLVSELPTLHCG